MRDLASHLQELQFRKRTVMLARTHDWQADFAVSPQDAVVYASIRARLHIDHGSGSCFISRDRHFDDPDLVRDLGSFNCKYLSSFDTALQYIEHAIALPPGL
jgi:hypothetical protein